ncbi:MAG: hypothetical protein MJA84_11070 [Firmicutes bacterium]|nr:hypothetical protein [Bacillota bacterium]
MNPKLYPPEKRLKISQRPLEEIYQFAHEVSRELWNAFVLKLPPVDGFRRGTPKELQRRFRIFINRISRWNDMEWMMFKDLWVSWVKTHPHLDLLLSKFDNSTDFKEDIKGKLPNSSLDVQCFQYLAQNSEESRVPRELIKRFYDFGYFQEDPIIEHYITIAKSTVELELIERSMEFEKMWLQFGELGTSVGVLSNRLDAIAQDREKVLFLVNSIDRVEKKLEDSLQKIQEIRQNNLNLNQSFQQLQQDYEGKLSHVYNNLESSVSKWLSVMFDQKCTQLHSDLIKEIDNRFGDIEGSFRQKVTDLLKNIEPKVRETAVASTFEVSCQGRLDQFITVDDLSVPTYVEQLNTPKKFACVLSENFQTIGMQSLTARILADEVLAALAAGQIVSFRGSMASIVALLCARTLAGPNIGMLHIPIGLLGGREFSTSLYRVLEESGCRTSVSALILEGINLSAPEVYARSLRQLISERFLKLDSTSRNLLLFGTIIDGLGALDITAELCEWGPIFHTDCLEWRDKWSNRSVTPGSVSSKVWGLWISTFADKPEDWDDLYEDYSHLGGHPTVLWRRCLYNAAARLNIRITEIEEPTLIQSLVFGWLLPRGLASGVNLTDYESLLAGGRVDASKTDKRIAKLLSFSDEQ